MNQGVQNILRSLSVLSIIAGSHIWLVFSWQKNIVCDFFVMHVLHSFYCPFSEAMTRIGDGWQNEMSEYFYSIEKQTKTTLKRIKQDRIQRNLPFDDSFKDYFLRRASTRWESFYKISFCETFQLFRSKSQLKVALNSFRIHCCCAGQKAWN